MHMFAGFLLSIAMTAPYAQVALEDELETLEGRLWSVINSTDPDSVKEFAELLKAIDDTKLAIAKRDASPRKKNNPVQVAMTSPVESVIAVPTTEPAVVLADMSKKVVVDRATYTMNVYKDGNVVDTQRVIVGRPGRTTPAFSSVITHVVLNPYWNVSPNIATLDLAPLFDQNPKVAIDRGYRVYNGWTHESPELDPLLVDWSQYGPNKKRVPFMIRQEPGPNNVLGKIKFIVKSTDPTNQGIFLHGTEDHSLFDKTVREFSSGCVRVENDVHLAKLLLNGDSSLSEADIQKRIDTGKTKWLKLRKPVEVVIQ